MLFTATWQQPGRVLLFSANSLHLLMPQQFFFSFLKWCSPKWQHTACFCTQPHTHSHSFGQSPSAQSIVIVDTFFLLLSSQCWMLCCVCFSRGQGQTYRQANCNWLLQSGRQVKVLMVCQWSEEWSWCWCWWQSDGVPFSEIKGVWWPLELAGLTTLTCERGKC